MWKIEFGMAKMCTEIISLKTKRTHTLTQAMTAFIIIIQKKKPSVIQRTYRSDTSQKRPEEQ